MLTDTTAIRPYLEQARAAVLPGAGQSWLDTLRAEGLKRFAARGFPTPRLEAWRYTNLRALEKLTGTIAPAGTQAGDATVAIDAIPTALADPGPRLVFVNGRARPELSRLHGLPAGVTLAPLADVLGKAPAFVAAHYGQLVDAEALPLAGLNTALAGDGALLHIPRGTTVATPIELVFLTIGGDSPVSAHPRILVVAEEESEATIVEHHAGFGGVYFANAVAEVAVGRGARVHHYKHQAESADGFHIAAVAARIGRDATYDTFVLTTGAKLSRHDVRTLLDGTGVTARVSSAYAVGGDQHTDFTSFIDHAHPDGTSREVVKGVIDGTARAVFQGKILVRKDAQRTDGYQLNQALLLADGAEIDSKPELEIYADDVKCSHGATAGALDEDHLFYLRARGIPEARARALLIGAFLTEAVEEVRHDDVRAGFVAKLQAWLEGR